MPNNLTPISKLGNLDKLSRAKDMRLQSYYADMDWIEDAQRAQAFKAGDQWTDEEKAALAEQGREPMVWNYIHSTIELLIGVLTQNPILVRIMPVERTDGFLAEVMEELVRWVEENQTDADVLDTEAFEDCIVTGRGFRTVDIQPKPDNPTEVQFIEECVPFYQVKIDPGARRQNLSDARWVITEKWVTLEDFKIRYPDHASKVEDIFAGSGDHLSREYSTYAFLGQEPEIDDYTDGYIDFYDVQNSRVLVCQMEYYEHYFRYFWVNPENPAETREVAEKQAKLFPPGEIRRTAAKKVRWLHFTGDLILFDDDSPVYTDGYSTVPMFAYADKSKKIVRQYGIVKPMIDPQRECNRRWMQAIRLMAHQGTGLMGEVGAFVDLQQAQDSWTNPEEITLLNKGGLTKVTEKSTLQFPAASIQMEEISRDAMKQITGVNPDMLGIREKEEPGIVIKLRQQQGQTIISKLFRNYKRMKKYLYKLKVNMVAKYMPDWQIAKIIGETDRYVISDGVIVDKTNNNAAPIRAIRDMKYNLRFEDAPGNMSKQMSELAIYMQMIAQKFPVDPNAVIDRLDISESDKSDWKQYIAKGQQQQQKMQQMAMQTKQAEMQLEMKSKAADSQAKGREHEIAKYKIDVDARLRQIEHAQKAQLEERRAELEAAKARADQQQKRMENMLKWRQLEMQDEQAQRDWVLALSEDERANLEKDLKLLGMVQGEITSEKENVKEAM